MLPSYKLTVRLVDAVAQAQNEYEHENVCAHALLKLYVEDAGYEPVGGFVGRL